VHAEEMKNVLYITSDSSIEGKTRKIENSMESTNKADFLDKFYQGLSISQCACSRIEGGAFVCICNTNF
jgi:hypothetical protein